MKFDLTIKDATQEEVARVLNLLNGERAPENVDMPKAETYEIDARANKTETAIPTPPVTKPDPVAATLEAAKDADLIPQPPAASAEAGDEIDTDGLPWDERIHSSNRQKTTKGLWRRKRGVQDPEYNEVKAELLGQTTPDTAPAEQPTVTPPVAEQPTVTLPPAPPVASAPPSQPPAAAAPAVTSTPPVRDFNAVMTRIQAGFQSGQCTPAYIPQLAEKLRQFNPNLVSVPDIANDDNMIATAHAIMDQDGIS